MRQLKFSKSVTIEIKWKDFEAVFYKKYFPDHVRDRFDREFQSLQQDTMTVSEYEAAFAQLEHFAQVFNSEERRVKRFLEGLQFRLKLKVMACQCQTVAEMVEMASHFEDEYK